jgi:hypothetical protein
LKYSSDSNLPDAAHRYSPGHVSGVEKVVIRGNQNGDEIQTSHSSASIYQRALASRRFTRLTNGFSTRLQNHCPATALWIWFCDFCRIHESLCVTQGMALGVTDHLWSDGELMNAARAVRRATDSAQAGNDAATGNATIQIDCRSWRERNEQAALRTSPFPTTSIVSRAEFGSRPIQRDGENIERIQMDLVVQ